MQKLEMENNKKLNLQTTNESVMLIPPGMVSKRIDSHINLGDQN